MNPADNFQALQKLSQKKKAAPKKKKEAKE